MNSSSKMEITPMMLATDLDGTFLAGDPDNRQRLYQLINAHPGITLVFVTGRGLEVVVPLLSDPAIPRPDYIICDVGATLVDGETLQPVYPVQSDIEQRWPGEQVVGLAPALQRRVDGGRARRRLLHHCREGAAGVSDCRDESKGCCS